MRRLLSDTLVVTERNLIRLPRAPELLIAFTVQPIMFVLGCSGYVFGGAIQVPGGSYAEFLIPGIIVQNIAFGEFVTALGLNEDMHKGLIDRFLLPADGPCGRPGGPHVCGRGDQRSGRGRRS